MISQGVKTASLIIQVVYFAIGIPGNLVSGAVFLRQKMRSPYTGLVVGLAVCDALLLSSGLIYVTKLQGLALFPPSQSQVPPSLFFSWMCGAGSKYFTLAIAVERFYVVFYPIHAHSTRGKGGLWTTSITVGFLAALIVFGYIFYKHNTSGFILAVAIVHFIPFPIVVLLTVALWRKLKQIKANRKNMTSQEQEGLSVTRMLLAVTTVFGFCSCFEFPQRILFMTGYYKGVDFYDFILSHVSDHLYFLNSAVNFIIYGAMSQRFRGEVRAMFSCKTADNNLIPKSPIATGSISREIITNDTSV